MTSRVYHGYQQDWSQLRSALPILPSTQRPDFQLIFKRLLSKSACPGPRWGLTAPPDPQLEKVGLDHPVEKSFPRHCSLGELCCGPIPKRISIRWMEHVRDVAEAAIHRLVDARRISQPKTRNSCHPTYWSLCLTPSRDYKLSSPLMYTRIIVAGLNHSLDR